MSEEFSLRYPGKVAREGASTVYNLRWDGSYDWSLNTVLKLDYCNASNTSAADVNSLSTYELLDADAQEHLELVPNSYETWQKLLLGFRMKEIIMFIFYS